jgi:protein-L-isoaspartate(D-aspartate) O-methyltransferase
MSLVDYLISNNYLKTPIIIDAFYKIKREDFLPEDLKDLSDLDQALPIGEGQTISQPAVVAFMLELLQPKPGEKILDIGSGSGWTTALLAQIVSNQEDNKFSPKKGKVFAIEIIPELLEFGKKNISKYNFLKRGIVEFFCKDGKEGLKEEAPFDRILVSAAAKEVPKNLKEQLRIGGRIVIPISKNGGSFSQSIFMLEKKEKDKFKEEEYPGFVFVPLV